MEFLKRKHFSLGITWTVATHLLLASRLLYGANALQGVPTWICLGLKSPFIEFSNELEVLANNSIPLNITKDEQALMHQEGLRNLGAFIKPVDLRDSTTGFVKANLTKKVAVSPLNVAVIAQRRLHPIQEEMDQKQIILLDEDTDENGLPASLTDEDRKFIVPMALKNASPDPRWQQATFRGTATTSTTTPPTMYTMTRRSTTPATPEFASNIEDLKKHILFLQNLTKHDSTFQSKFVVFPSLQRNNSNQSTTTTTRQPYRSIFQYSAPIMPPTRKSSFNINSRVPQTPPFGGYYHNQNDDDEADSLAQFFAPKDKITIVPQVLLLNDQNKERNERRKLYSSVSEITTKTTVIPTKRTTTTTTTTTTTESTTITTSSTTPTAPIMRRPTKPTKLPPCVRNPESTKCVRQRKREEMQRQRDREQLLREQEKYMPRYEPYVQTLNNTKRFAISIEIPDSFKMSLNESGIDPPPIEENLQILSRFVRSTYRRRQTRTGTTGRSDRFAGKYVGAPPFLEADASAVHRNYLMPHTEQFGTLSVNGSSPNATIEPYSEPINLNPDNCYQVDGMTYGQKKQCVLHTSVMPAISRGARAAIQECQFQFKNRRWNCTNTDDNTVFGPMTGMGSPEMAFIHALAAATVTSFIARACRDGQLASCGCSSGSRPKQLHDDWTWGGCGDNLEYAYKFATDFIDVREKETKRGTRGAGNPEKRKNLRSHQHHHQHHNQQQQQQQQRRHQRHEQMLADEASIAAAATALSNQRTSIVNTNLSMTTTNQRQQQQQQQQQLWLPRATNYNNRNEGDVGTGTGTLVSAVAVSLGSVEDARQQHQHPHQHQHHHSQIIISIENSNKTVNSNVTNVPKFSDENNNNNTISSSNNTQSSSSSLSSSSSSSLTQPPFISMVNIGNLTPAGGNFNALTMKQQQRQQQQKPLLTPDVTQRAATSLKWPSMIRQEDPDRYSSSEEYQSQRGRIRPEDLLELQERITKEILNSNLEEKEMLELQEKISREIFNSKVFNMDAYGGGVGGGGGSSTSSNNNRRKKKRKNQRAVNGMMMADIVSGYNGDTSDNSMSYAMTNSNNNNNNNNNNKLKNTISLKARSLMNLHNNEAGRRAVIKKTRITCKCHGVSGSCSLITCWQQLSSIREIGDYLREKYEESTEVKLNKRGRLQVKDAQFKVPTAHDLVYLDESPDWCRNNRQLQWPGTHGRICNKTSNGLDGCGILCCGRGYNTKSITVRERCNCKFHWCCQVKCEICVRTIEEHTCK